VKAQVVAVRRGQELGQEGEEEEVEEGEGKARARRPGIHTARMEGVEQDGEEEDGEEDDGEEGEQEDGEEVDGKELGHGGADQPPPARGQRV